MTCGLASATEYLQAIADRPLPECRGMPPSGNRPEPGGHCGREKNSAPKTSVGFLPLLRDGLDEDDDEEDERGSHKGYGYEEP